MLLGRLADPLLTKSAMHTEMCWQKMHESAITRHTETQTYSDCVSVIDSDLLWLSFSDWELLIVTYSDIDVRDLHWHTWLVEFLEMPSRQPPPTHIPLHHMHYAPPTTPPYIPVACLTQCPAPNTPTHVCVCQPGEECAHVVPLCHDGMLHPTWSQDFHSRFSIQIGG